MHVAQNSSETRGREKIARIAINDHPAVYVVIVLCAPWWIVDRQMLDSAVALTPLEDYRTIFVVR